jgi:adenylate kinase family enzyme
MANKHPTKIHIIGAVGSGKTTLAKRLAANLNYPCYELDNVVWKREPNGDIRRSKEDRDQLLQQIILTDSWIVEGAHLDWVSPSFEKAELIIFLDPGYVARRYQIIKRFIKQRWGIEKANYHPSFEMLKKMFQWTSQYEKENKIKIGNTLDQYKAKVVFITRMEDLKGIIGEI